MFDADTERMIKPLSFLFIISLVVPLSVFGQAPVKEELLETVSFLYPYTLENGQLAQWEQAPGSL